jgi:hypothetical protein
VSHRGAENAERRIAHRAKEKRRKGMFNAQFSRHKEKLGVRTTYNRKALQSGVLFLYKRLVVSILPIDQ